LTLGVGHANATPADLAAVNNYLDSLRIAGVNIEGHRESLLNAGFTVCDDLRTGTGEQVEVAGGVILAAAITAHRLQLTDTT
jgi:hypothetical protein